MAGPVKSAWAAPQAQPPPAGQPAPAGQVGTAWSGGTTMPFFGSVGGYGGGPSGFSVMPQPGQPQPQATSTPPSAAGAATMPTDPNAPVWDPETKTASGSLRADATVANQQLGGYGTFAGAGSYPGDTRQPPAPQGTLSGPGTLETAWDQHGEEFFAPGPSQEFNDENKEAFTAPTNSEEYFAGVSGSSAPQVENRADQAYDQYQRNMPTLLNAPDLGSYYDVAEERAQRSLSDAQAARGVFGSSVASGQASDLTRGLNAERANREADYNLARNADFRSSLLGASQAGRAGDITDLQNANNELSWRAMLGNLAGGADSARLGRLGLGVSAASAASGEKRAGLAAGMTAAGMAQGAEEGRERGSLQDMTALYMLLSSLGLGTYGDVLGTDMDLQDGVLGGGVAGATNAFNMDEAAGNKFFRDVGAAGDTAAALGWLPFAPSQPQWPRPYPVSR